MTVTYTWSLKFETVDQSGLSDVVRHVHWDCVADDGSGGATGRDYGKATFMAPGDPFTPFGDLTEAEVIEWLGIYDPASELWFDTPAQIEARALTNMEAARAPKPELKELQA